MKMKQKFFAVALAILMLVPVLASFSVMADAATFPAYNDKADGELLYHADFTGADGVWPTTYTKGAKVGEGAKAWVEKVSADLLQFENCKANKNTVWGIDTTYPTGAENSYTVTFSMNSTWAEGRPAVHGGFAMDGKAYFFLQPNGTDWELKATRSSSIAHGSYWGDYAGVYQGSGAQTYAVEMSGFHTFEAQVTTGEGEEQTTTTVTKRTCSSCILYAKLSTDQWVKIYEMTEEDLKKLDFGETLPLKFVLQDDYSTVFSDVNIYKGVSYINKDKVVIPPPEDVDTRDYDAPELVVDPEPSEPVTEEKGCASTIAFQGALFMIASATVSLGICVKKKKFD